MVPTPARGQVRAGEDEEGSPRLTACNDIARPLASFGFATGSPAASAARSTSSARTTPARSASARSRSRYDYPAVTRPHRGRPAEHLALRRPAPGPAGHRRHRPPPSPGWTQLVRADNLAHALGHARAVGQGRLRQPDALVQGPGGRGGAGRRPRARLQRAGLPVHRQPGQRGRRRRGPGRGCARCVLVPPTWSSRRSSRPRSTAARSSPSRAPTTTSTGSASELAGEHEDWALRQRQRAALLRRGLQDARLRDRRAARLAAARAGRDPDRLGLAADQGRQGLRAS